VNAVRLDLLGMAQTAQAFFIGRIIGSSGFRNSTFCRWWIVAGQQWNLENGESEGQTQVDAPVDSGAMLIWSHPLDIHYQLAGVQGWPKLSLEVWEQESLGRSALAGYGFVVLPMSAGHHDLKITLWKPVGSMVEGWSSKYCGAAPHLKSQELVHTPTSRPQLTAECSGLAHITLNVILGGMKDFQSA
jgi:hypothetical protein